MTLDRAGRVAELAGVGIVDVLGVLYYEWGGEETTIIHWDWAKKAKDTELAEWVLRGIENQDWRCLLKD